MANNITTVVVERRQGKKVLSTASIHQELLIKVHKEGGEEAVKQTLLNMLNKGNKLVDIKLSMG